LSSNTERPGGDGSFQSSAIPSRAVILIHPPVVKPSEPPAGLAKLSGALDHRNVRHILVDANLEAILYLLEHASLPLSDAWTARAQKHIDRNLACLREWATYHSFGRYQRAVADVNRLLERSGGTNVRVSLVDYEDRRLSPQKSGDLMHAAEHPDESLFHPYFRHRLPGLVEGFGKDPIVGFSLNYLSQALSAFAMAGLVRREFPNARIVLGGSLVTSWASNPTWKNPFRGLIDDVISGPGEDALLAMVGERSHESFLPTHFDGFPLDRYLSPGPVLPYSASWGCYWRRCSFCPEKAEGTPYRPTPPDGVIAHLQELSSRHKPALIHLVDNALSPALMTRIAENPFGAPWYGFARISPHLADVDFCKALKASGCVMLKVGLESGDQGVLDALEKGVSLENAEEALAALKKAGVATYVYLLFGTPPETGESAQRTLHFVAAHSGSIDFLNVALFNLPVHCPEGRTLGLRPFYDGDLALYADFVHPSGWDRRAVRTFLDREFRKHPAIRPILLRQPPLFTSNHAPFFHMGRPA
jgi:hypothetical protein